MTTPLPHSEASQDRAVSFIVLERRVTRAQADEVLPRKAALWPKWRRSRSSSPQRRWPLRDADLLADPTMRRGPVSRPHVSTGVIDRRHACCRPRRVCCHRPRVLGPEDGAVARHAGPTALLCRGKPQGFDAPTNPRRSCAFKGFAADEVESPRRGVAVAITPCSVDNLKSRCRVICPRAARILMSSMIFAPQRVSNVTRLWSGGIHVPLRVENSA